MKEFWKKHRGATRSRRETDNPKNKENRKQRQQHKPNSLAAGKELFQSISENVMQYQKSGKDFRRTECQNVKIVSITWEQLNIHFVPPR